MVQSEIKQLKKQLYKAHVPLWQQQTQSINGTPFLYLELEAVSNDDLKAIAQEIEKVTSGFSFFVSKEADHYSFFGYVAKGFEQKVALKEISNVLKEKFDWRGGGNATMIQGGGTQKPEKLKETIIGLIK